MCDLEIPLSFNKHDDSHKSRKFKKMLSSCSYCGEKIKCGALIGCHRFTEDFLKMNYDSEMLYFCDFICAKLYDTNVNLLSIDVKDYRQKFLTKQLSSKAEIIYKQVNTILFTQMPVKKCTPLTQKDFERVKESYRKIL